MPPITACERFDIIVPIASVFSFPTRFISLGLLYSVYVKCGASDWSGQGASCSGQDENRGGIMVVVEAYAKLEC